MKRPEKYRTETCGKCQRPGWTHREFYTLLTPEEYGHNIEVKGLPEGFEPMSVGCGGSIYSAVQEAIDYCREYNVRGVGFEFNERLVTVTATSTAQYVVENWWKRVYGETPAQSFAKR